MVVGMKKRKPGRPRMKPSERRTNLINVRITDAERKQIEVVAMRDGRTLSEAIMQPWRKGR